MAEDAPRLPDDHQLFEHAACGLLVTSRNGTIRRVNDTFCRWIGHPAEALVERRRLQDLLTMGGRIFHQTHWAPLLQMQGSVAEVKLDVVHREGHTIPMMMNALRRTREGEVQHEVAVFVAEDRHKYERELLLARQRAEELAAQRAQAQAALMAAQEEISRQREAAEDRALFAEQMMGIVSHDLRNPLSAIHMGSHLLSRGELTANQRAVLGRIDSSTARALRLITDLLDFTQARLGSGLTITRAPIQLHARLAECLDELRIAYPARALEHDAQGEGACAGDADRLSQLVGNLVSNAMAYGAADRAVRVRSMIGAQTYTIVVHNEGPPIPASLQPQLFEPMIRGTHGKNGRGVGLGLFIVREIARAHGGSVAVSSSVEAGTTFTAELPRA